MEDVKRTVLVVADRVQDCQLVLAGLGRSPQFHPAGPVGAIEALRRCARQRPLAALVHVHLADLSGEEVCSLLKGRERTAALPLLLFTPYPSARRPVAPPPGVNRILGPADCANADRHLASVLVDHNGANASRLRQDFRDQQLVANFERAEVRVAGQRIDLRPRELRLLQLLVSEPGRTFSRAVILKAAWDDRCDGRSRTVDVHIRRLREKLGSAGVQVETIVGLGYRFSERVSVMLGMVVASCCGAAA